MNKKVAIIIGPNWRDYAEKYLVDCVESVRRQDYEGEKKIFITDNETTPESYNFIAKTVPEAELILNKENDGFAKGSNDAIKLALIQGFEYIILFNMDTEVDESCVSNLVKTADENEDAGAIQPRIMLWQNKDTINSLGNSTHFLGFGYCLGYKKSITNYKLQITNQIFYPSGAAVLLKSEVLKEIGLFDEEYWMYNEDQELGWRVWLAGYKCILAPDAVIYHKYEFARSTKQFYWMDRNRIITILKYYHILTLILIFPAFIIMELGLVLFSLKTGWFKEKIRMWKYFLTPRTWKYIIKSRREVQRLRKRKDSEIVKMISGRIWYQEVDDWKLRFINPFFDIYWKIVRAIIIW